jgi:hypothetical protein
VLLRKTEQYYGLLSYFKSKVILKFKETESRDFQGPRLLIRGLGVVDL